MATRSVDILLRAKNETGPALGQLQGSLVNLKGAIAALGIGFGIRETFSFLTDSLKEFAEAEKATAKLAAVLEATGGAAGLSAAQLKEFADQRERLTAVDADAITNAQAILATFTNIQNDVFRQAITAAQDLAATMDTDLKSAVVQVGKALNDPEKGLKALSRVGVSFDAEQTKLIESLMASNRLVEAQKIILRELQHEFGGVSEAIAETTGGRLQALTVQWGNFKEEVGGMVAPALEEVTKQIRLQIQELDAWRAALDKVLKPPGGEKSNWLSNAIRNPNSFGIPAFNAFKEKGIQALELGDKVFTWGMHAQTLQGWRESLKAQNEEAYKALFGDGTDGKSDVNAKAATALANQVKATVSEATGRGLEMAKKGSGTKFGDFLGKLADEFQLRPHQILAGRLADVFGLAMGGVKGIGGKLLAPFKNVLDGNFPDQDTGSRTQDAVLSPFIRYGFGEQKDPIVQPLVKKQDEVKAEIAKQGERHSGLLQNLATILERQQPQLELRPF